jgi:tRNA (guanine-N7-)-methyltransferase
LSEDGDRGGAFWGRRKGTRLRAHQDDLVRTLLPHLRVPEPPPSFEDDAPDPARIDLADLFAEPKAAYWLEIGFGGGEHLAHQAEAHPDFGLVGCEPFVNGMAKLLAAVEDRGLANLRLWDRDATELLPRLPAGAFERIYLLYPDPWPKRRQRKRRFVSDETLRAFARLLKPGGQFRFATDIDDYAGWTLARILRSPDFRWTAERADDWRTPFEGWPGTRYEAKALREGRTPSYLVFERI